MSAHQDSVMDDSEDARSSPPPMVLNIPRIVMPSIPGAPGPGPGPGPGPAATSSPISVLAGEDPEVDESIGEFDDGRSGKLTLCTLIQEGLIEPGDGVMTIDYLGQTFKGDLLPVGKIKSQETNLVFNNPSAWAIYCKKIVNPAKKSGCGWASVKYKGRKMDHFKTQWTKMKSQREAEEAERKEKEDEDQKEQAHGQSTGLSSMIVVKHSHLAPKSSTECPEDILVAVETFPSHSKVQPFTVSVASSALLLIDLHTHLSLVSTCGYLAGHWDLNTHNLAITHAFPCLTEQDTSSDQAAQIEFDIYNKIYNKHLTLIGWYRSEPKAPRALPTITDCESQLEHQVKLLGNSDASYTPCVGLMIKPYASLRNESDILFYWVIPPPENSPQDYGKPMKMSHSVVNDPCLSQEVLESIDSIIQFYEENPKLAVSLDSNFNSDTLLITKMGRSLLQKFPKDQDDKLWRYIRMKLLGPKNNDLQDPLIAHHPSNGSVNGHGNEEEEEIDDVEEEEIDDDEDNALRKRRGYRSTSSHSNSSVSFTPSTHLNPNPPPMATTDEVISLLLQKQAPVAPMAHSSSHSQHQGSTNSENDQDAPLDFSAKTK